MSHDTGPVEGPFPAESIRAFYDDFTESRRGQYLREPNLRIERAAAFVLRYLTPDDSVLEVGCGIGLVTDRIAQRVSRGRIRACDISPRAIQIAQGRIQSPNVEFRSADIVEHFETLRAWLSPPIRVVAMVDVIEHLPLTTHLQLLRNLRGVMTDDGILLLTYPSPQYQRYLHANAPSELQIVDEVVELEDILRVGSATGFGLKYFALQDVWMRNQYVHCVLATGSEVVPVLAESDRCEWTQRLERAWRSLTEVIPAATRFVLVDQGEFGEAWGNGCPIPFLERDGQYAGPPPDVATAIREVERLRRSGVTFMVFGWPAFWWLDYYAGLADYLHGTCRCVLSDGLLLVFELRGGSSQS